MIMSAQNRRVSEISVPDTSDTRVTSISVSSTVNPHFDDGQVSPLSEDGDDAISKRGSLDHWQLKSKQISVISETPSEHDFDVRSQASTTDYRWETTATNPDDRQQDERHLIVQSTSEKTDYTTGKRHRPLRAFQARWKRKTCWICGAVITVLVLIAIIVPTVVLKTRPRTTSKANVEPSPVEAYTITHPSWANPPNISSEQFLRHTALLQVTDIGLGETQLYYTSGEGALEISSRRQDHSWESGVNSLEHEASDMLPGSPLGYLSMGQVGTAQQELLVYISNVGSIQGLVRTGSTLGKRSSDRSRKQRKSLVQRDTSGIAAQRRQEVPEAQDLPDPSGANPAALTIVENLQTPSGIPSPTHAPQAQGPWQQLSLTSPSKDSSGKDNFTEIPMFRNTALLLMDKVDLECEPMSSDKPDSDLVRGFDLLVPASDQRSFLKYSLDLQNGDESVDEWWQHVNMGPGALFTVGKENETRYSAGMAIGHPRDAMPYLVSHYNKDGSHESGDGGLILYSGSDGSDGTDCGLDSQGTKPTDVEILEDGLICATDLIVFYQDQNSRMMGKTLELGEHGTTRWSSRPPFEVPTDDGNAVQPNLELEIAEGTSIGCSSFGESGLSVVYQDESGNLRESWMKDWTSEDYWDREQWTSGTLRSP